MAATSPYQLLFENLYPVDQINAGAGDVLNIGAPMTAGSFAELLGRLALYALAAGALLVVAGMIERGGRARTVALAGLAVVAVGALAALAVRPELVRHGLQFAYGWIPAGAAVAVAVLLWRRHRTAGEWSPAAQAELLLAAFLVIIAARTYAAFFANATVPQQAAYAIPVRRRLPCLASRQGARRVPVRASHRRGLARLPRPRGRRPRGRPTRVTVRFTSRAPAAPCPSVRGRPRRTRRPWTPSFARPRRATRCCSPPSSPRSTPSPAAPTPSRRSRCCRARCRTRTAEREAIRRLDESGVDLAVINTRPLTEYGQGAFGDTYYRSIQDWLDRDFGRVASFGNDGETTVALDVWQRRTS